MRFKNKNDGYSFASKIIGDKIRITAYAGRKKIGSDDIDINEYLKQETEYGRNQYLFNADVNDVKTDNNCVADRNLDFIQESVTYTLKEANLFQPTFAEIVKSHRKSKEEAPIPPSIPEPIKPIKPVVKNIDELTIDENCENQISQKQLSLTVFT